MNKTILIGNLVSDPELRKTQSNKSVCEFRLAVNDGFGENRKTDFITCVVWETYAENLAQYQHKGNKIAVVGKLKVDSYEKNGEKRYKTYVLVSEIFFLDKREKQEQTSLTGNNYDVTGHMDSKDVTFKEEDFPWY